MNQEAIAEGESFEPLVLPDYFETFLSGARLIARRLPGYEETKTC